MNESSGGFGFAGLLFLVFLVLKLTHVIDWSWWWVTAPLWIPACVALLFFVAALIGMAIGGKTWR
ncbi:hypothetical protein ACFFGR_09335 [Arthrobacter liuii]|uniref:hypothetical protein n=1 Tax=Arthrobacter liuii TaxID=1476996 RepID=UPI00166A002E|nr:hypothetical protein [Arthrobacter liuii]